MPEKLNEFELYWAKFWVDETKRGVVMGSPSKFAELFGRLLAEYYEYRERADRAENFIRSEGYRRCDIPACNCPSWHGGLWRERLMEANKRLKKLDALESAGVDNWEWYDDAVSSLHSEDGEE